MRRDLQKFDDAGYMSVELTTTISAMLQPSQSAAYTFNAFRTLTARIKRVLSEGAWLAPTCMTAGRGGEDTGWPARVILEMVINDESTSAEPHWGANDTHIPGRPSLRVENTGRSFVTVESRVLAKVAVTRRWRRQY